MGIFLASVEQEICHRFTGESEAVALVYLVGAGDNRQCYCEYVEYSFHHLLFLLYPSSWIRGHCIG
jgi:hypothetical protein